MKQPTQQQIKEARINAGLTQKQAAELVHYNIRSWQKVESGDSKIHLSTWELFKIKTKNLQSVQK